MLQSGEFIRDCGAVEKRALELVTSICYTVSKLYSVVSCTKRACALSLLYGPMSYTQV